MQASQAASVLSNYIADTHALYVHEAQVWDEGQEYGCGMTITVLSLSGMKHLFFQWITEMSGTTLHASWRWSESPQSRYSPYVSLVHSTALTHRSDSSPQAPPMHLWMTKLPSKKLIIWVLCLCVHAEKDKTHDTKDIVRLTMNTEMKNVGIKCIREYRVTNTCEMLPHQKLDEEWGICGMFCNSCTGTWVCQGGKAADWMTHSKWEEPCQEVAWHNDDVMGKPKDSPRDGIKGGSE